jgi:hypothetical protein
MVGKRKGRFKVGTCGKVRNESVNAKYKSKRLQVKWLISLNKTKSVPVLQDTDRIR